MSAELIIPQVRLILVSKLKPPSDILSLHSHAPQQYAHFGENYVQELQAKANQLPKSIKWHFIGGLQSNKCKALASDVEGLWCVSSVDSAKKANELEKGRRQRNEHETKTDSSTESSNKVNEPRNDRLRIQIQVNTSGEDSKSGVEPGETLELCKHVIENCTHLQLTGFMTIGAIARSQATTAETENEDFIKLRDIRQDVAKALDMNEDELELSMGMSGDFENAIKCGSDEVRVGSTIFGERAATGSRVPDDQKDKGGRWAKEDVQTGNG